MSEPQIKIIEGQFQRVAVGRHDIIVLTYPDVLSAKARDAIRRQVRKHFPDHKILIVEDGLKLGVIHKDGV
jgi:hypothetical protein